VKRRFLRLAAKGHRLEDKTIHLDRRVDNSMTGRFVTAEPIHGGGRFQAEDFPKQKADTKAGGYRLSLIVIVTNAPAKLRTPFA
jgi:hypothetical protein